MKSDTGYTFALDDSGGVEPLLGKNRKFFPGDFPFFIISSVGINNIFLDSFCNQWNSLRKEIQGQLGLVDLPPLHARLMFGKTKPQRYRGSSNPYLLATDEQVLKWYLSAIGIVGSYIRKNKGAEIHLVEYERSNSGRKWEETFQAPEAEAEGEFLKLIDRKAYPQLHRKYIAHVSAALAMPTLDTFLMIQETMRQCGAHCSILLDGYSDADGFNEKAAFNFINEHLGLGQVSNVVNVSDTDSEPLCQAADLVAYMAFRDALFRYRTAEGADIVREPWVGQAAELLQGPRLCALDISKWVLRHKAKADVRAVFNAARYAIAHHEIGKYAPTVVEQYLQTPEDFLGACQQLPADVIVNADGNLYLPILKSGVLETWQATRSQKGEDRSKSGPVDPTLPT